MLKRQRPATPPPSSFGDPLSFLPDRLIKPLPSSRSTDQSQHRSKRQRVRPPPLDGALRGWLESEPVGRHWESDGEEDWTEDAYDVPDSSLPPSTAADQYKDANNLLHELHFRNQHRLLIAHPPRDRRPNTSSGTPLPTAHEHPQIPPAELKPVAWSSDVPSQLVHPQLSRSGIEAESRCFEPVAGKRLVEEVHWVRQHYEDANRLLGSLFLSRRREVEEMTSSADTGTRSGHLRTLPQTNIDLPLYTNT